MMLCTRRWKEPPKAAHSPPLLSNLLLDELDRELERRGHRFVRYADDCNIHVRSLRAGQRVLASTSRYLSCKLKLTVNEAKSAVGRPWERKFLGFSFSRRGLKLRVSEAAAKRFKEKIRELTGRTRGRSMRQVVRELYSERMRIGPFLGARPSWPPLAGGTPALPEDAHKYRSEPLAVYVSTCWAGVTTLA